jgi:hypothetical protein
MVLKDYGFETLLPKKHILANMAIECMQLIP